MKRASKKVVEVVIVLMVCATIVFVINWVSPINEAKNTVQPTSTVMPHFAALQAEVTEAPAPAEEATEAPVEEADEVPAPAEEEAEAPAPAEEAIETPAEEEAEAPAPAEEAIEAPAEEEAEAPAPAEEAIESPVEEVAEVLAEEVAEVPTEEARKDELCLLNGKYVLIQYPSYKAERIVIFFGGDGEKQWGEGTKTVFSSGKVSPDEVESIVFNVFYGEAPNSFEEHQKLYEALLWKIRMEYSDCTEIIILAASNGGNDAYLYAKYLEKLGINHKTILVDAVGFLSYKLLERSKEIDSQLYIICSNDADKQNCGRDTVLTRSLKAQKNGYVLIENFHQYMKSTHQSILIDSAPEWVNIIKNNH